MFGKARTISAPLLYEEAEEACGKHTPPLQSPGWTKSKRNE
jgi:hypothetical protein